MSYRDYQDYREYFDRKHPDGFRVIKDIKDDPSVRKKRWEILNMPETREFKDKLWKVWVKKEYERGLITYDEYFKLRAWNI